MTLLILTIPLFLATAIALLIQGKGSVIFRQTRVGLKGQPFSIYKFQTMFENAESGGPFICQDYNDDRITPVGYVLRKSKIDELPQLINVLKGEMSLIGPRPERPCFHEKFSEIKDWTKRVEVKPGITGLAQISAVISHNPRQKILADLAYSANRTLWSDFRIILMTACPALRPKYMFSLPISR